MERESGCCWLGGVAGERGREGGVRTGSRCIISPPPWAREKRRHAKGVGPD